MKKSKYDAFLEEKARLAVSVGFEPVLELSPALFPFQRDVVLWALKRGRAAIFADCGLGKTIIEHEWARHIAHKTGKPVLILAPLAVAEQMVAEGKKFKMAVVHARDLPDVREISATNYERLHLFYPPEMFGGLILDESSILKSHDGKTRNALIEYGRGIPYRLCCTATPAPNDHMELGNHAEFLDILTRAEMLATFFTHDGGETAKWRLKGHAKRLFWKWMAEWSVAFRKPSDIGHDDAGFVLPPLEMHEIVVEDSFNPKKKLFSEEASTLDERRGVRRASLDQRVKACADLVAANPNGPWIIWCNLNAEGDALAAAIPNSIQVSGSDSESMKETVLNGFSRGKIKILITKPTIAGFGMNWQHCSNVAFVGLSDSYEQFYQAIRRCWRFGQKNAVHCYVITCRSEGAVVRNIKRKESQSDDLMNGIVTDMKESMLKNLNKRAVHERVPYETDRKEGKRWTAELGDSVELIANVADSSVDYIIFSPPFASLYTYTSSLRDMGNCRDDKEFFQHFRHLIPEMLRALRPGRLLSMHCMNLPKQKSVHGFIGLRDFRGELIWLFEQHGFIFHSEVCIWKDPLVAMQRTKAIGLLHKQIVKDAALSRQGVPDYLITFRKRGDNEKPITHKPNGFQQFIGENAPKGKLSASAATNKFSHEIWQRYASPVWMDINPSKTLQFRAAREKEDERHICPLQLQVIARAVELWTNPDDLVFSPFAGIGSEGYVSLQMGRRFHGIELKKSYYDLAVKNLDHAETHGNPKKLF